MFWFSHFLNSFLCKKRFSALSIYIFTEYVLDIWTSWWFPKLLVGDYDERNVWNRWNVQTRAMSELDLVFHAFRIRFVFVSNENLFFSLFIVKLGVFNIHIFFCFFSLNFVVGFVVLINMSFAFSCFKTCFQLLKIGFQTDVFSFFLVHFDV